MRPRSFLAIVALALAAGCGAGSDGGAFDAVARGELVDGAVLSGGRVVGVGHERLDGDAHALALVLDADGRVMWSSGLPSATVERGGHFEAVAVRTGDEADSIYAAGRALRVPDRQERGVVVAFRDDGTVLWESTPWPDGASDIEAIRMVGDDLYVTGFAEIASDGAPPSRGMLVARLASATGAVEWADVLEAHRDPLGFTAGVSLDVSASGFVGAVGFAAPGGGRTGWLVGMWNDAGERLWESLRTAPDGADLGWEGGDLNLAHEGHFDGHDELLVIGNVFSGRDGSDASLVRYAPDTGAIAFEIARDAALTSGAPSFDEGTALVTRGERAWLGETVATQDSGVLLWEAFVVQIDTVTGEALWEVPFGGIGASGESVLDLALDEAGHALGAGTTSDDGGVGKHFTVAKWDPDGGHEWTTEIDVPGSDDADDDEATRVLVAPSGDVWALGRLDVGDGVEVPAICRLDADGRLVWSYPAGARAR